MPRIHLNVHFGWKWETRTPCVRNSANREFESIGEENPPKRVSTSLRSVHYALSHACIHTLAHTISRLSWLWSTSTIERNVLDAVHRPVVVCHICATLWSAVREIPCELYWYGFTITPLYWWYYTHVICIIYLRFWSNAKRNTIYKWSETG